ncbi:ADP-ribosylglycohydrolase family protein [Bacillus massiliigorillae]|uniref:ADP-ribosylglycohydrolase family protein n=1 Tax=Bacillus massiliigorillae TaxID=1243664 RepID=UPI00039D7CD9|nr:ADP-ribosylglycohydrolase family protein [Bacillus massiliigorillae]
MTTNTLYQIKSALFGLCVGDALGVPVEFLNRGTFPKVTNMKGYGTHNKPPGTWSDDSSMTLCTMESLCNGYNIEDMKQKFCQWMYEGYWTHDGIHAFDIGITTSNVLSQIRKGVAPKESGERDEYSNGNGSLMRILPLAFYVKNLTNKEKFTAVEEVSGITHAHIRSKIACSIYIEIALNIMNGQSIIQAYNSMKSVILNHYFNRENEKELLNFTRILQEDISRLSINEITSTGYVISTLEAAIWCLLTTGTYEDAVVKAVNLGQDTDTVGAVTGGLAGLHYGLTNIPSEWLQVIARKKDIEELCEQFSESLT